MEAWVIGFGVATVAAATGSARLARSRLRRARADHANRPALWDRFYGLDWGDTATNNYGFAPAEGEHPQRFQHQMYRELLKRLGDRRPQVNGLRLLEVSCGRGGGLNAFLDAAPTAIRATGLDVAANAIAYCRQSYAERDGLDFVHGTALDLPFPDASFDAVINVEASNDYGDRARFFCEVARVLKPDGLFLYTDSFKTTQVDAMRADLAAAGFAAEFDDITANVAEACRLDTSRRRGVIRRHAPVLAQLLIGKTLANYAGVEGSAKYRQFLDGRRTYLMAAAERA